MYALSTIMRNLLSYRNMMQCIMLLLALTVASGCKKVDSPLEMLPEIAPENTDGMAKGVAAAFCGVLDGGVVMAGGANFPMAPAAEGGMKVFYDGVYYFKHGKWSLVTKLPYRAASGATALGDGVLYLVGGLNEQGAIQEILMLSRSDDAAKAIEVESLLELPFTVEQCGAAVVDGVLYIVGGNHDGVPSNSIVAVDIETSEVEHVATLPTEILQPVVVAVEGVLYIWGGYSLPSESHQAKAIDYGFSYDVATKSIAKLPGAPSGTLTGSSAVVYDQMVYVVGGVNNFIFEDALNRRYKLAHGIGDTTRLKREEAQYMNFEPIDFAFTRYLQIFDPANRRWRVGQSSDSFALAGAGVAELEGELYVINGEVMPGVRTPRVFRLKIN